MRHSLRHDPVLISCEALPTFLTVRDGRLRVSSRRPTLRLPVFCPDRAPSSSSKFDSVSIAVFLSWTAFVAEGGPCGSREWPISESHEALAVMISRDHQVLIHRTPIWHAGKELRCRFLRVLDAKWQTPTMKFDLSRVENCLQVTHKMQQVSPLWWLHKLKLIAQLR